MYIKIIKTNRIRTFDFMFFFKYKSLLFFLLLIFDLCDFLYGAQKGYEYNYPEFDEENNNQNPIEERLTYDQEKSQPVELNNNQLLTEKLNESNPFLKAIESTIIFSF